MVNQNKNNITQNSKGGYICIPPYFFKILSIMKKFTLVFISLVFCASCASLNSTSKGDFTERISRVTPKDIMSHTQKILVGKHQFTLAEEQQSRSTIYLETDWKDVQLTKDEKDKGLTNVRVRFKVRSNATRTGATNEYTVHNLVFTGNVEAYKSTNGSSNWVRAEITPQRNDYLQNIYDDFQLEFDSGVMEYGDN